ncbi:MAG: DUF1127 domain-containing protein [Gemmobacter sp.]
MTSKVLTARPSSTPTGTWRLMATLARLSARHRTAHDLARLDPHLLRDVGLPEGLAHLAPSGLRDWLREMGQ